MRANCKQLLFGATSLTTGAYRLSSQEAEPFHDLLYASAAFPVAFDPIPIGDELWTDGGIRAVTPLGAAIRAGADAVDMLLLTPTNPTPRFDPTASAIEVGLRCLDIMLDEIVDNDAKMADMTNRLMAEAGILPGKRHVDIRIIRPAEELPVTYAEEEQRRVQPFRQARTRAAPGSRVRSRSRRPRPSARRSR